MRFDTKFPVAAVTIVLALGASSTAFAKAHDQGVADDMFPASTSDFIQNVIPGPGVSLFVNTTRGDTASANGADNAVDPVVGNGANEPD